MSVEDNKKTARRGWEEMVGGKNLAIVGEIYAPNAFYHGGDGNELRGVDSVKELVSLYITAFPDMSITVEDCIGDGDRVATRITARGTHTGNFGPVPPTGKRVEISVTNIQRFENGKVAEEWETFNELHFMRQLGLAPEA